MGINCFGNDIKINYIKDQLHKIIEDEGRSHEVIRKIVEQALKFHEDRDREEESCTRHNAFMIGLHLAQNYGLQERRLIEGLLTSQYECERNFGRIVNFLDPLVPEHEIDSVLYPDTLPGTITGVQLKILEYFLNMGLGLRFPKEFAQINVDQSAYYNGGGDCLVSKYVRNVSLVEVPVLFLVLHQS